MDTSVSGFPFELPYNVHAHTYFSACKGGK